MSWEEIIRSEETMSKEKKNKAEENAEEIKEELEKNEEATAEGEPEEAADAAALKKENKKLSESLEELNGKYLRMMAEYDNFRKRSAIEKERVYTDAYIDVIGEILPVIDNLERAVQFAGDGKAAEGLSMTLNQFADTIKKLGVEVINAEGEKFDPELHNAVMHIEDETLGESVVAEVFQKGYKKGDRVIRYAVVKVAN